MNTNHIEENAIRAFLKSHGIDAAHASEPIRQEASIRRYIRLRNAEGRGNLILSINPPFDSDQDDFVVIARYLAEREIPVPHIHGIDEGRGWLLLSEGGERDLSEIFDSGSEEGRQSALRIALDLMIELHDLPLIEPVATRRFDYEKLWSELEFLFQRIRLLCERFGLSSPVTFELEMFLQEVCDALDREAAATGEVFTHRDFHTRNILVGTHTADEIKPTLIDFQDARAGSVWYDLTSLLWDPYTDLTPAERDFGYDYYIEKTGRGSKRARDMYHSQALQRIFKALGTYLFQVYEKDAIVFFPSIGKALSRLEEIAQRAFFPDSVYLFVRHFEEDLLPRLPGPGSSVGTHTKS